MDNVKQQIVDRLKQANNVLVTVSANPSVDQLAACIGLTIMLNKLGKHGTAVFSGNIPSTIEFLQPEKTLEKNTDSLQDFIIALDKSKADKLRYKVEDKVVKIFITPYRTSISEKDLNFSQGDFNVDVVMALGVKKQEDLDKSIIAHGRILHDATVVGINNSTDSKIGSVNWQKTKTSSLCELVYELGEALNVAMDVQVATALLTGIVAETERFSNNKTSSQTMSISAALMAAGANQQLVATKLEAPPPPPPEPPKPPTPSEPTPEKPKSDGTLEIHHDEDKPISVPAPEKPDGDSASQIQIDDDGTLHLNKPKDSRVSTDEPEPTLPKQTKPTQDMIKKLNRGAPLGEHEGPASAITDPNPGKGYMSQPPSMGGSFTSETQPEALDPSTDPLSKPQFQPPAPLLDHSSSTSTSTSDTQLADDLSPEELEPEPHEKTIAEIEETPSASDKVSEPEPVAQTNVDSARNAVEEAIAAEPSSQSTISSAPTTSEPKAPSPISQPSPPKTSPNTLDTEVPQMPLPPNPITSPPPPQAPEPSTVQTPQAAPSVPPPFIPPETEN